MHVISVIGASEPSKDGWEAAEYVGRELAKRGFVIICGGMMGVMEAVSKGAKEEGGLVIGIMPSCDGSEANPYVDIKINTCMNWNRNPIVVASGEMVIAIEGSYGTLSELAYALIFDKYIVGYNTHKIDGIDLVKSPKEIIEKVEYFFYRKE